MLTGFGSQSDEYTSVSSDTIDKPRSRLASPPFHGTQDFYNSARRCAIVPTNSMRNAPVSYWPKSIFRSPHQVISNRPRLARSKTADPSPLHLMSGSIDNGHCPILLEHTKSPPPRSCGWSIPHHGSTSTNPISNNKGHKNKISHNTTLRSTDSLVSPRQSVTSLDGDNDGSLRWSTASEASFYNSSHNQLRDTFEPLGLSAPPRAAFLRRCSHLKPPVFQPIKWRRSRDSHRATPSRLSVFAPPPPPGKTHSIREFGQWSPTAVRAPPAAGGEGGSSRFSTIVDEESGGETRV